MNQNERVAFAMRQLEEGRSVDEVLAALRNDGCSMGESTLILADARRIDMDEARELVIESESWRDYRASSKSLEKTFWETGTHMGEEQDDGSFKINLSDL